MLTSWKEIAGFLNVSPRTAQLYEKTRGLPVVRMGTRPAIRESELRAWQVAGLQYPAWWERVPVLQAWALTVTVLLLVASAGWWWMWRTTRGFGDPAGLQWNGSILTAYDAKSRPLWSREFPYPATSPAEWNSIHSRILDLDQDGQAEIVFAYSHINMETQGLDLYCLSAKGGDKWRYAVGRDVANRSQTFRPPYVLRQFRVFPSPEKDGRWWVAAVFVHHNNYPSVLVVLDSGGKVRGEYWHAGHLNAVLAQDLDGDGITEIVAGGVRHGAEQAVLVVFDPRNVHGTSQIGDTHVRQIQGMGRGTEKAVVYFPRSAMNRHLEQFNYMTALGWVNGEIEATVYERMGGQSGYLVYTLGKDLSVRSVLPSVSYTNAIGGLPDVEKSLMEGELEKMRGEVRVERR